MKFTIPNEKIIPINANLSNFKSASNVSHRSMSIVEAILVSLSQQGISFDRKNLIAISSVAFSNYVYHAGYNQHDPLRKNSLYSELISNYGIYESIEHYTGNTISEVNGLPADEFWKLVQFEVLNGRPLVSLDENLNAIIIVGYRVEGESRYVQLSKGCEQKIEGALQGTNEAFVNWGVLVRPREKVLWKASELRQKMNLLRWVVEHGLGKKEFFQETRENYGVGIHGFEIIKNELENADREYQAYFSKVVGHLIYSRAIAAEVLMKWASELAAESEAIVEAQLRQASEGYAELVNILSQEGDLRNLFSEAIEKEKEALLALEKATQFFPSIFG